MALDDVCELGFHETYKNCRQKLRFGYLSFLILLEMSDPLKMFNIFYLYNFSFKAFFLHW